MKEELLKSFHEQFALNQNHHQSLFIQFISAVFVVIVGYGIIYSDTTSTAKLFDVTKDSLGNVESYSIIHLVGTYFISQFVLILLGSFILNIGYAFRRDQKVIYEIRNHFLETELYEKIFGHRSFNPTNKEVIFNSFLPDFNLIFISFIYFLQFTLLTSIIVAFRFLTNFEVNFCSNIWSKIITFGLLSSPILLSAKYLHHYYNKYKKTVN